MIRARWLTPIIFAAILANIGFALRDSVSAASSAPVPSMAVGPPPAVASLSAAVGTGAETTSGGVLSPCPGIAVFTNAYRYTNGLVHRGCATGYSVADSSPFTACPSPFGHLYNDRLSVAVSANVPILNRGSQPACGMKVKVCGTACVVTRVTDRGPYVAGGDYGRDMDMSIATRRAIGVNVSLPSWGDPVIFWWKPCSPATPLGATRCSP